LETGKPVNQKTGKPGAVKVTVTGFYRFSSVSVGSRPCCLLEM